MIKLIKCTCPHAYQDRTYGKGQRVANGKKDGKSWTCTVCNKIST